MPTDATLNGWAAARAAYASALLADVDWMRGSDAIELEEEMKAVRDRVLPLFFLLTPGDVTAVTRMIRNGDFNPGATIVRRLPQRAATIQALCTIAACFADPGQVDDLVSRVKDATVGMMSWFAGKADSVTFGLSSALVSGSPAAQMMLADGSNEARFAAMGSGEAAAVFKLFGALLSSLANPNSSGSEPYVQEIFAHFASIAPDVANAAGSVESPVKPASLSGADTETSAP